MKNPDQVGPPPTVKSVPPATQKHAHHAPPAHVTKFIQMALPAARTVQTRWGVPASVLLAQAALESGWGRHVVNNAYFGIKGKAPSGDSATFDTTEVIDGKVVHIKDTFRAYKDFGEAADDYGQFLSENSRYKDCFLHKGDPIKFVQALARAGYATDPNYAKSLTSIIRSNKLDQYDH